MESVWDNWLLIAMLSPAIWALISLLDVCLVSQNVYRKPLDGAIVSGLYCGVPTLYFAVAESQAAPVLAVSIDSSLIQVGPALLAGVCFFFHVFYYFKALFATKDASSNETLNLLSVLIVPLLAFVLLGERLAGRYYVALGLALCGVIVLVRQQIIANYSTRSRSVRYIALSVLFISLTMVLQAKAFETLSYGQGFAWFSLSSLVVSLIVTLRDKSTYQRILDLFRRYFVLFAVAEGLAVLALLTSQRATAIGPSVSLVAMAEAALPLFIMLFSYGLYSVTKKGKVISSDARQTLATQFSQVPTKLMALTLIIGGIGVSQLNISI